ncbi:MarR family transcriptional regulator [Nocardia terpenica]|uniref:MarR family winged helix-turn-helix transcriptional regulator n=1 Tax=Nocardia terpenica TaxID=455432 RepID=UPI000B0EC16A|nr:MarR family transcriptional regulator [Nocardia terpenica]MBF6061910.1 MarR family transcriptional regulator [Nocardia terpenica]MBF6106289.1 MarR family transcriptional regulator [Nocardia terpenica]MBF6110330.1 MarR family transcriptional regulator [Nocardia terpenica]MBF6120833.1 MarR family transcriptional regulator [Nocardia terpenica]MBF6151666.1 MarR family transcriptional regulator [Nocardia terpenica]
MPHPRLTTAADPEGDERHIVELERAINRLAHLLTRVRRHDRTITAAGVNVDRANVSLLRVLADTDEPLRLGELAARLDVEAPHVTRQVQRLERTGFVARVPDPDDRRAQRVRLTPAGYDVVDAIREVIHESMREALAEWTSEDLRLLATLNHRMVDDFCEHAERAQCED